MMWCQTVARKSWTDTVGSYRGIVWHDNIEMCERIVHIYSRLVKASCLCLQKVRNIGLSLAQLPY